MTTSVLIPTVAGDLIRIGRRMASLYLLMYKTSVQKAMICAIAASITGYLAGRQVSVRTAWPQ